jgi:hypothetical protein
MGGLPHGRVLHFKKVSLFIRNRFRAIDGRYYISMGIFLDVISFLDIAFPEQTLP